MLCQFCIGYSTIGEPGDNTVESILQIIIGKSIQSQVEKF